MGLPRLFQTGSKAAAGTPYLFRDEFITAEAAPITSPRTAEPGPGSAVIVDTADKLSISGGKALYTTATVSNSDPKMTCTSPVSLSNGDAWRVLFRINPNGACRMGSTSIANPVYTFRPLATGVIRCMDTGLTIGLDTPYTADNDYKFAVVGSGGTQIILYYDGVDWLILWPGGRNVPVANNLIVVADNTDINLQVEEVAAARLGLTTYGTLDYFATDYKASALALDTINHAADGFVKATWVPQTNDIQDLMFRYIDDDNCWIMRCDQAGSRLYLYEKDTGVETERGAVGGVAITWTPSSTYHLTATFIGTDIILSVDNTGQENNKISYASATFNQTETLAKTLLPVTNFISYPRTVPVVKMFHPFF